MNADLLVMPLSNYSDWAYCGWCDGFPTDETDQKYVKEDFVVHKPDDYWRDIGFQHKSDCEWLKAYKKATKNKKKK